MHMTIDKRGNGFRVRVQDGRGAQQRSHYADETELKTALASFDFTNPQLVTSRFVQEAAADEGPGFADPSAEEAGVRNLEATEADFADVDLGSVDPPPAEEEKQSKTTRKGKGKP